ncbi:MAG: sugar ABC transporter ATP-binding protein, partial [Thiothrix sp.]|nr:sugar ABC transporter ATP-binding protein [Thiothrix sp.]
LFQGECLIDVTEPTGADVFAIIELNGREVVGRMRSSCGAKAGEKLPVVFNMRHAVLFDPQTENRIG